MDEESAKILDIPKSKLFSKTPKSIYPTPLGMYRPTPTIGSNSRNGVNKSGVKNKSGAKAILHLKNDELYSIKIGRKQFYKI